MRKIHFVGSLPKSITEQGPLEAMAWALDTARAWPDTEGGSLPEFELTGVPCDLDHRWIIDYLDRLASEEYPAPVPALRVLRKGDSSDYDHMPILRPGPSRVMNDAVFSMDRVEALKGVIDAYRTIAARNNATLPPLRISLPNPLDLALFVFVGKVDFKRHPLRTLRGTWLALRNLKHFLTAMKTEVSEITRYTDPEVTAQRDKIAAVFDIPENLLGTARPSAAATPIVWQFETPGVLYALQLVPRFLRPALARLLAKQVAHALAMIWYVETEAHLCDGDLDHKNITTPTSAKEMVMFLNPLADELEHRGLPTPPVHLPFAYGDHAPSTDSAFYKPLEQLAAVWRIYAGVVDENDPKASRIALHLVEEHSGRAAEAVACACGLGRREEAAATKAVEATLVIAGADRAPGADTDQEWTRP